jgi:hypothetical protein
MCLNGIRINRLNVNHDHQSHGDVKDAAATVRDTARRLPVWLFGVKHSTPVEVSLAAGSERAEQTRGGDVRDVGVVAQKTGAPARTVNDFFFFLIDP